MAHPTSKKALIPDNVREELLRLQVEDGWSDGRLAKLLEERWAIKVSRCTVNRLIAEMTGPRPAAVVVEVEVEPPPELMDEDILGRVKRDLYRAERMAFRDRKFGDQVRAAQALIELIFPAAGAGLSGRHC